MSDRVDILYITYNRPHYVRLSLPRLLETCRADDRVWLWHNGDAAETLSAAREHADHPKVARFHHSEENQLLRVPTNWFWDESEAPYVAKVDDDCLMPDGWIERLLGYHHADGRYGIISAWPFLEEDFREELGGRKVREFGGKKIMVNPWTGGSGYLAPRGVIEANGPLREGENFSGYCIRAALGGAINGWPMPLLCMDHMDDPRSPNSGVRTEDEFERFRGLTARRFGVTSYEEFCERTVAAAMKVQRAPVNARYCVGWRAKFRRLYMRLTGEYSSARFNA